MNKITAIKTRVMCYAEIVLAFLGFLTLYLVLAFWAPGGPLSTDVTWYMNVGLNGIKDTFILNRYFHVFLEAVFLKVAASPLVGLQHYWAFLISGTCLLIYLTGRYFSRYSQPLHGLIGVGLFLSIGAIADTAGIAFVDTTAMLMMLLLVGVYIISNRIEHRSMWLIAFLGFLFYLALKTKETTLSASILLIGFGFTDENTFTWKVFLRRMAYLAAGFIAGAIFFVMLNWVFLGDPIFSLRPGELRDFLQTYVHGVRNAEKLSGTDNWYTAYLLGVLWIPSVLYLISGAKIASKPEIDPGIRLVWLVPLAEILFVTITIGNQWGFLPRFVFPALPIICLLGPQFLNLKIPSSRKDFVSAILLFCIGLASIVIIRLALRHFLPGMGWDVGVFLAVVFMPALLSIILALAFFWRHTPLMVSTLISILIIAIVAIPITDNGKKMIRDRPNLDKSKLIFYPFSAFSDQFHYIPDMQIYVSRATWGDMGVGQFAKDPNEVASLFNIYFDSKSTKDNFTISTGLLNISYDLLFSNYTNALLSLEDWQTTASNSQTKSQLEQKYQVFFENQNRIVFLKAR